MSDSLAVVANDLVAEQRSLEDVVSTMTSAQWQLATASPGWAVVDQIAHLTYFDQRAGEAIADPVAFHDGLAAMVDAATAGTLDDFTLGPLRALSAEELVTTWREARVALLEAAASLTDDARIPWYGPSMRATSFLAARLMETWAHGVDVVDALGVERAPTSRLRHVARLGFKTRPWSYSVRGEALPPGRVRVELLAPNGSTWVYGDEDADDLITGSALDFCLVVTQRRHVKDTTLVAGELGRDWLGKAQAFAGGPTDGPPPRSAS